MDETWAKTLVLARLAETREIKLKRNHDRYPDIGLMIKVSMPYEDSPDVASMQYKDYIGEYCGHGQSKTAFILNGPSGDPPNMHCASLSSTLVRSTSLRGSCVLYIYLFLYSRLARTLFREEPFWKTSVGYTATWMKPGQRLWYSLDWPKHARSN